MKRTKVVLNIVEGCKSPLELGLCLIEPNPKPLFGVERSGKRYPAFRFEIKNLWKKYPKPHSKKLESLLWMIADFGERVPVGITILERDDKVEGRWVFKGRLLFSSRSLAPSQGVIPVKGWFNISTQKGRASFFEMQ